MSSSIDVELNRVNSEINTQIQMKIKFLGKYELYTQLKSKEGFWDDIRDLLQYGSTSENFFSSGLATWKSGLTAVILLFIYFKWWDWIFLFWIGIGAAAHAIILTIIQRKADNLFEQMNNIEEEAKSELFRIDLEFGELLEQKKELEDLRRDEYTRNRPVYTSSEYDSQWENKTTEAQSLVCSQCGKVHGKLMSVTNLWHKCNNCGRIFCDTCGSRLSRDMLMPVGVRKCVCGATTSLVSY